MRCEEIRELLPAYEREQQPSLAVRRHLASCADCRTELAFYKDLATGLHDLRRATFDVPPQLTRALVEIPARRDLVGNVRSHVANVRTHVTRNRAAYVGGAVAVAGALGATLWRVRSRRPATA